MRILLMIGLLSVGFSAAAMNNISIRIDGHPYDCQNGSDEGCSCGEDPFATDGSYTLFYDGQYYMPRQSFDTMVDCVKFMNTSSETLGVCH